MGKISERERERMVLRQWAETHMDRQTADAFMNSSPPAGWDDFATKADVAAVKSDVAAVKSDVAAVRADIERNREATAEAIENLGARLTAMFSAQLATEMLKVQEKFTEVHEQFTGVHKQLVGVYKEIGAVRGGQRSQTVALIVTILVALFGQAALPHFLPPPAPIVVQSSGD